MMVSMYNPKHRGDPLSEFGIFWGVFIKKVSVTAVSYTHLDVYKRQTVYTINTR